MINKIIALFKNISGKVVFFYLGLVVVALILQMPGIAEWAATDVVVSGGYALSLSIVFLFLFASPLRSKIGVFSTIHCCLSGAAFAWIAFTLFGADLFARVDRLWTITAACVVTGIFVKAFFGDLLNCYLAYLYLRCRPDGRFLLSLIESLFRRNQIKSESVGIHWQDIFFFLRRFTGFCDARSYSIELAFQWSLDYSTKLLREKLHNGVQLDLFVIWVIKAFTAEVELYRIVFLAEGIQPKDCEGLQQRILITWDLLRFAKRSPNCGNKELIQSFLTALKRLDFNSKELSETLQFAIRGEAGIRQIERFSSDQAPLNGPDVIAAIVLADMLLEVALPTFALSLFDNCKDRGYPLWARASFARIRLMAEESVLNHRDSMESSAISVWQSKMALSALAADDPLLKQHVRSSQIPKSFFNARQDNSRKWTGDCEAIARAGLNKGPDIVVITLCLGFFVGTISWYYVSRYPIGEPLKEYSDLYRKMPYNAKVVSTADLDPRDNSLVLGTLGGGIHRLNTSSFRMTTEKADSNGLTSNWIPKIAISDNGTLMAMLAEPPLDDFVSVASHGMGLSVKDPDGKWFSLISPKSVRGLSKNHIQSVSACGAKRILIVDGKLLLYDFTKRSLTELVFDNISGLTASESIAMVAGEDDDPKGFWAVTSLSNTLAGHCLYRVNLVASNKVRLEKVLHEDIEGKIAQIAVFKNMLFVQTNTGQLYKYGLEKWELILGNFSDFDIRKVSHVIGVNGDSPGIWFTGTMGTEGPQEIRMLSLHKDRILPLGPWIIGNLTHGIPMEPAGMLVAKDLSLGKSSPTPFARWNSAKRRHELLVAGKVEGFYLLTSPELPVASQKMAILKASKVATLGEKVIWFDASSTKVIAILETHDQSRRRLVLFEWVDNDPLKLLEIKTIQKTSFSSHLKDQNVLALIQIPEKHSFLVISDTARILLFDKLLHGWLNAEGTRILDSNGREIKRLVSAAAIDNKTAIILDDEGRVFELLLQQDAGTNTSLTGKLVHQACSQRPGSDLEPLHLATEPDGLILFMGKPGSKTVVPWCFKIGNKVDGFAYWRIDEIETGKNLFLSSLTRLQSGKIVGPILALDEEGNILTRNLGNWKRVGDRDTKWKEIIEAEGGTFLSGTNGMARIECANEMPRVGKLLWPANSANLQLPVQAVAGLRDVDGRPKLLVGHSGGLSIYDTSNRSWNEVELGDKLGVGIWKFYDQPETDFAQSFVWVILTQNDNSCRVWCVKGNSCIEVPQKNVVSVTPAGHGLLLTTTNGGVVFADPTGRLHHMAPGKRDSIGDGNIVRTSLEPDGALLCLKSDGVMFRVTGSEPALELFPTKGVVGRITDFECSPNGQILLVTNDRKLWQSSADSPNLFTETGYIADLVHSTGRCIVAASPKSGLLKVFDNSKFIDIAQENDKWALVGKPEAWYASLDDLYVSGSAGAALHRSQNTGFMEIRGGKGIDRFEKQAGELIGWRGNSPLILKQIGDIKQFREVGARSLFEGPDGRLFGLSDNKDDSTFVLFSEQEEKTRLFSSEASLGGRIIDAAPISSALAAFKAENGDLVFYNTLARSYSLGQKATSLPMNWSFYSLGDDTLILPSGSKTAESIISISRDGKTEFVSDALGKIFKYPNSIYWKTSDNEVYGIAKNGKKFGPIQTGFTSKPLRNIDSILFEKDKTIFCKIEKNVYLYDINNGSPQKAVYEADRIGMAGETVVGAEKNDDEKYRIRKLSSGLLATQKLFEHITFGSESILGWNKTSSGIDFEIIGNDSSDGQIDFLGNSSEISMEPNKWASFDNRFVFFLCNDSKIRRYDTLTCNWEAIEGAGSWVAIGGISGRLAAFRKGSSGNVLDFFNPANCKLEKSFIFAGYPIFSGERFFSWETRGDSKVLNIISLDGPVEEVRTFSSSITPFILSESLIGHISPTLTLIVLKSDSKLKPGVSYLFISGSKIPITINGLDTQKITTNSQFIADSSFIYITLGNGTVARINITTGQTEELAGDFLGKTDNTVWIVRNSEDLVHKNVFRGSDLLPLNEVVSSISAELEIYDVTFMSLNKDDQMQIIIASHPQEADASSEELLVVEDRLNKTTLAKLNPSINVMQELSKFTMASGSSIVVFGRKLFSDGWFDDEAPNKLVTDKNGKIRIQYMNDEQSDFGFTGSCSEQLPSSTIGFKSVSGWLVSENNVIRYGQIKDAHRGFAADHWLDARPVSDNKILVVDVTGQVWLWQKVDDNWERSPIKSDTIDKVFSFALANHDNTVCVVALSQSGKPLAIFSDGIFKNLDVEIDVCKVMGQRSGEAGPFHWTKDNGLMRLSIRLGNHSTIELSPEPDGLKMAHSFELFGEEGLDMPVISLGSSGTSFLTIPLSGNLVERVSRASFKEPANLDLPRGKFSLSSLEFVPTSSSDWQVHLAGHSMPIIEGRFAFDKVLHAATLPHDSGKALFTSCGIPGLLVKQMWDSSLHAPILISLPVDDVPSSIRTFDGQLYISFGGEQWYQMTGEGWVRAQPKWYWKAEGKSSWTLETGNALRRHNIPVNLVFHEQRIALEYETFTSEIQQDGSPLVFHGESGIVYKTINGKWYEADYRTGIKTETSQPFRQIERLKHASSGLTLPKRTSLGDKYWFDIKGLSDTKLDLYLDSGRLPHENVVKANPYGSNGALLKLAKDAGARLNEDLNGKPSSWTFQGRLTSNQSLPSPDYEPKESLKLENGLDLKWKNLKTSFVFFIQNNSDTSSLGELAEIGELTSDGLPIDDPHKVRPLRVSGAELDFFFNNFVWSRSFKEDFSFKRKSVTPEDPANYTIGIDEATRQVRVKRSAKGNLRETKSSLLGLFSPAGQFQASASAVLNKNDKNQKAEAFTVQLLSPFHMDSRFFQTTAGWFFDLEKPSGIAVSKNKDLYVLGPDQKTVTNWQKDGTAYQLRGSGRLENDEKINNIVFTESSLYGALDRTKKYKELFFDSFGRPGFASSSGEILFDFPDFSELFGFHAFPSNRAYQPYVKNISGLGACDLASLPGLVIDRVHFISDDQVFLSDRYGHRPFNLSEDKYGKFIWKSDHIMFSQDPCRIMDKLIADSDNSLYFSNGHSIVATPSATIDYVENIYGGWFVKKIPGKEGVIIEGLASQTKINLMAPESQKQVKAGNLLIDKCKLIFKTKNEVLSVFPYGLESLHAAIPTKTSQVLLDYLVKMENATVLKTEADTYIVRNGENTGISCSHNSLENVPESAHEYLYAGSEHDWKIFSKDGITYFSRFFPSTSGGAYDIINESQLFVNGQFVFDHVNNVFWKPEPNGRLMLETSRNLEELSRNNNHFELKIVSSDSFELNKYGKHCSRSFAEVTRKGGSENNFWTINKANFNTWIPEKKTFKGFQQNSWGGLPSSFSANKKCWVVYPDRIIWIEQEPRWDDKHKLHLTRQPDKSFENDFKLGNR